MGRNSLCKEPGAEEIIAAVRSALAPYGVDVVDLTPNFVKVGLEAFTTLLDRKLPRGVVYVLVNCKAVRKQMGRGGLSMHEGPRRSFEESVDGMHRPFIAITKGVVYGEKIPVRLSLAETCKSLQTVMGGRHMRHLSGAPPQKAWGSHGMQPLLPHKLYEEMGEYVRRVG